MRRTGLFITLSGAPGSGDFWYGLILNIYTKRKYSNNCNESIKSVDKQMGPAELLLIISLLKNHVKEPKGCWNNVVESKYNVLIQQR